ncbi:beta-lactamase-like protein [Microdochium bolleyi]|uniref:Beta-lactamase-like protein n=1 Tax=Microdochium bolleyi TaxID=196109 RepID=A0A136IS83_9PEZI|nr:beta-lactamase-like protein [Microdochium bolleyi]
MAPIADTIPALEILEQRATGYASVSALRGGVFTIPVRLFVSGVPAGETALVPSLSFLLVEQTSDQDAKPRTVLFDLGLRRDISRYTPAIQRHLINRQPLDASHDVLKSLQIAKFSPDAVDEVILSHVHWDHIGTPTDFPQARFIVGAGSLALLAAQGDTHLSHSNFQHDLLRDLDVCELSDPRTDQAEQDRSTEWTGVAGLRIHDLHGNGIMYAVDSPGHLTGHIALLARRGSRSWVLLIGDACHDLRLLTGEKQIAEWQDSEGRTCCIHADKEQATETLRRFGKLKSEAEAVGFDLDIVFAHDRLWAEGHPEAFLPGSI